jgi:hypothetical protein
MVVRVEQEGERHFEDVVHLVRIGMVFERRLGPAHDRRHLVSGRGAVVGKPAQHLHARRIEADLLVRFAQRGFFRRAILGIAAPAGKADLPGVIGKVRGALREDDRGLGMVHDEEQDRGGLGRRGGEELLALHVVRGEELLEPRRGGEALGDRRAIRNRGARRQDDAAHGFQYREDMMRGPCFSTITGAPRPRTACASR